MMNYLKEQKKLSLYLHVTKPDEIKTKFLSLQKIEV